MQREETVCLSEEDGRLHLGHSTGISWREVQKSHVIRWETVRNMAVAKKGTVGKHVSERKEHVLKVSDVKGE